MAQKLLGELEARFEKNKSRHPGINWAEVEVRLEAHPEKLRSLSEMERSGGEPDVIGRDERTGETIYCDCSAESRKARRSVCYDREGQDKREKEGLHPAGNAIDMAAAMGIEVLTEEQYRELQKLGEFDLKTQSWLQTPPEIRKLGGAIFGADFANDATSSLRACVHLSQHGSLLYAARGFRGLLRV